MHKRCALTAMSAGQFDWEILMHSMKIKEVHTGSPSCRDSGGGITRREAYLMRRASRRSGRGSTRGPLDDHHDRGHREWMPALA